MAATALIGYDELDAAAARLQLAEDASGLHGSLCGFLAGGGRMGKQSLVEALHMDAEAATPSASDQALLERLGKQTETELADPDLGLEPLMPADDRPLTERADALVD